jgi:HD superfamily phosphohydrolase
MLNVTRKYYPDEIREAMKLFDINEDDIPIHEFFSYKLITQGEISKEIALCESKQLVKSVAELLVKSRDGEFITKNPRGYALLRKLVSGQLDADRMDYLLRDSTMSGVKFGLVDVDRVIKNMKIVRNLEGVYDLAFHERAIGSIEDMLDARYKMYRWFYSHHTVVVTNELIKMTIDKLIEEDTESTAKLFHWSTFEGGFSTDEFILSKLRSLDNRDDYLSMKGLLDRRYLPVSLFKSTPDFGRLVARVAKLAKVSEKVEVAAESIISFFEKGGVDILQNKLEKIDGSLGDCKIYQTDVKMKPYRPFVKEDRIYLFRSDHEDLCELWSESGYFRTINEEWGKYHGLYLFYLLPGKQKKDFAKYKEKIHDFMAKEIAIFYRS